MKPTSSKALPVAEQSRLKLGFMRLSDSAPLIMAKELGLYDKYGLEVSLHREVSWANVRDKIIAGALDASQMLAPMPLITTLGAAGIRAPIITGLVLSLNGNGITLASALKQYLQQGGLITSAGLKTAEPLNFATVHPFSTHTLLLRKWLHDGGIDPDRDVRMIVLPPEQMVDSLAQGIIDGYCVGEPWNSIAIDYGLGFLAASGVSIWPNAPEKVLGVKEHWHTLHPATHLRLRLALMEACRWLAGRENRELTVSMLSRPEYLDLPVSYLRPSLIAGPVSNQGEENQRQQSDFRMLFHSDNAGLPQRSQAESMLEQCAPLVGKSLSKEKRVSLCQQCYRTDLYIDAARVLAPAEAE